MPKETENQRIYSKSKAFSCEFHYNEVVPNFGGLSVHNHSAGIVGSSLTQTETLLV